MNSDSSADMTPLRRHFSKMHPDYVRGDAVPPRWWTGGFCSLFAHALAVRFDLPIYGLIEEAVEDGHRTLLHAVGYRDGVAWDAEGGRPVADLLRGYGFDPVDGTWMSSDWYYPGERTRLRFEPLSVEAMEAVHADFDPHPDALPPALAYLDAHPEIFAVLTAAAGPDPEMVERAARLLAAYLPADRIVPCAGINCYEAEGETPAC